MASNNFFKNFNEVMNTPSFPFEDRYAGTGIPQLDERRNTRQWKDRVAVPFSYIPDGESFRREYGTLYVPGREAKKIRENGTVKTEDVDIYGADLERGVSLTADGFRKLFNSSSGPTRSSFRIETQAVEEATKESDKKPTILAKDSSFIKNLRDVLRQYQQSGQTPRRDK